MSVMCNEACMAGIRHLLAMLCLVRHQTSTEPLYNTPCNYDRRLQGPVSNPPSPPAAASQDRESESDV
jgi:hypothetical protein